MKSSVRWASVAILGGMVLSSCASMSLNSIPLPGSSYHGGYNVVAEFANVLNLPDRAKVVMDGTTVGVVTNVIITNGHVDVTARIDRDVAVPSNSHALLQQATVLGDIYLALEREKEGGSPAPPLGPGGRIPISHTTSPPQLEDTIAHLATFIGSGSIQRAQNTLIGINRVTPSRDEVRKIASRVATDLSDLSKNIDLVDLWLGGLSDTGDVLYTRTAAIKEWFSPEGLAGFRRNVTLAQPLGEALPRLGSIYLGGFWLIPALNSLSGALESVQHAKWAVEEEYPAWRRFFTNSFLSQDKFPAINITSIVGPDGRELSGDTQQVLRMLGATP